MEQTGLASWTLRLELTVTERAGFPLGRRTPGSGKYEKLRAKSGQCKLYSTDLLAWMLHARLP